MSKSDAKKGLKQILLNYLRERDRLRELSSRWLTIIVFYNFHQQTIHDFRAAKDQFSQYLKMAATLNLYTTAYKDYISSVGESYDRRLEVNACT